VSKEDYGRWMSAFREHDMGVQRSLDEVASGLASGTISRRKAFKLAGAALLSSVAMPLAPDRAEARRRRRRPCCTETFRCGKTDFVSCRETKATCSRECLCTRTVEGNRRCGNPMGCTNFRCDSTRQCENRFGRDFFCQRRGTGCCGKVCIAPCGVNAAAAVSSTRSNAG
jgi:hypothetical protein